MKSPRSPCPIATALDIFGDRWTLLVLRDLMMGKTRFGDFLSSPEKIATNVLSDRLARLEAEALIRRALYSVNPDRYSYHLTRAGAELLPVLQALCRWSNTHRAQTWPAPARFMALQPEDLAPPHTS